MGKKLIRVKVIPNSGAEEVVDGDPVVVKVREPAERNRANLATMRLLAEHFGAKIKIISGHNSRRKVVELSSERNAAAPRAKI
jgi:uncharacterized protein (TIGR00251 family)